MSTKTRPVIELIPLGQIGADTGETRAAQELFENGQLILAPAHAVLERFRDEGGHAEVGLGGLDPQPIGDVLAQRDRNVFHDTKIV
ncbi:MAG: hypothetical protein ABL904_00275 [Hyphomicrobiaceae bacterium]